MRCNFVDLYHALYGMKRPLLLSAPETSAIVSGMPRIPKLSDKHRSVSPIETKPLDVIVIESNSREASQHYRREPELNTEDDHYSINEERSEMIKVRNCFRQPIFFFCRLTPFSINPRRRIERRAMPKRQSGRQTPRK